MGGFAVHEGMDAESFIELQKEYGQKKETLPENNGKVILPERSEWAIRDMEAFCSKNGIRLTFFATPVPQFVTDSVENYEGYVQAVKELLADCNSEYVDYNLTAFDREDPACYNDDFHLSEKGAAAFTKELCDLIAAGSGG